jgi:hypothetical protein
MLQRQRTGEMGFGLGDMSCYCKMLLKSLSETYSSNFNSKKGA